MTQWSDRIKTYIWQTNNRESEEWQNEENNDFRSWCGSASFYKYL